MDMSSEYSSGCESGWTTYFDQLSYFTDPYSRACITTCEAKSAYLSEDQEDEDLSMVSDASSGPPTFQEHGSKAHSYGYPPPVSDEKKKGKKKSRSKEIISKKQQQNLCLDDTASSPVRFSQRDSAGNDDQNGIYAASHFEAESTSKKQISLFKYAKGKSGNFLGRKRQ